MQVEAGQIGRQGASSAGIALNANGLGGRFDDAIGLPQTVVRRSVLDQHSITDALDVLCRTRAHIASNALLTCREGFAVDLETTPAGHGWMYPTDGLLVHGNHYQAGVPAALAAGYRPMSSDSLVRVPRAEAGLRALRTSTGPDESRKIIRQAMSDHLGHPESLCTHPDPRSPARQHWTTLVSSLRGPDQRRIPRHRRHPLRPRVPARAVEPLRRTGGPPMKRHTPADRPRPSGRGRRRPRPAARRGAAAPPTALGGGKPLTPPTSKLTPTTTEATGRLGSANWLLEDEPDSLDLDTQGTSAGRVVLTNVCERLYQLQPDMSVRPFLAREGRPAPTPRPWC